MTKENQVVFSFQNPISNNKDNLLEEPGGIGLANVQKRLQMLYPGKHKLDISETDEVYTVELKINIQPQKHESKTHVLYN